VWSGHLVTVYPPVWECAEVCTRLVAYGLPVNSCQALETPCRLLSLSGVGEGRNWTTLCALLEASGVLEPLGPNAGPCPVESQVVLDKDAFCGGLDDTFTEPEKCTGPLWERLHQTGEGTDEGPTDLMLDALQARYKVTIRTGDVDRAGTDATIRLALEGSGGRSNDLRVVSGNSPVEAPYLWVGEFERGHTDYVYVQSRDLGILNRIWLSQNGTGLSPGWYIQEISVQDLISGRAWVVRPQSWLIGANLVRWFPLQPYLPVTYPNIPYQVSVVTGDRGSAGTDADVKVEFVGRTGWRTGGLNLDTPDVDDFERGSVGYYTVSARDVGEVAMLRLSLSTGAGDASWYCQEVVLRHPVTGQVWVFPVNAWLQSGSLMLERAPRR
jgi:hypothetical protein